MAGGDRGLSGLARFVRVLRLFSVEAPAWTVQAMSEQLGVPGSTLYRVVGELVRAGMLEAASESRYRLGAAFVEFDRLTRLSDPLVRHGGPVLAALVGQAGLPCVGLLCRLYGATVMCVGDAAAGAPGFRSRYERGRPMPLVRGATSKAILAHLPSRRLTALLAGQAVDGRALRAELTLIRRRGVAVSRAEIDAGLVGLAAPVRAGGLAASLSLVVRADELDPAAEARVLGLLATAATELAGRLD